jgi:hypothetical protein
MAHPQSLARRGLFASLCPPELRDNRRGVAEIHASPKEALLALLERRVIVPHYWTAIGPAKLLGWA